MESASPATNGGLYNLRLAKLLNQFLNWEYTSAYEWVLREEPVTIAVNVEIEDYKGNKKWITKYQKVRLEDLCWRKLWESTYAKMPQCSKFKRVKYCIDNFPIFLEQKKKLLGWDFTIDGPENENY